MAIHYVDIPLSIGPLELRSAIEGEGNEIDRIYQKELKKATSGSLSNTIANYYSDFITGAFAIPIDILGVSLQLIYMLSGVHIGLPNNAERVTAESSRNALEELIQVHGELDPRVEKQRKFVRILEKMERIRNEHAVNVEFYYDNRGRGGLAYACGNYLVLGPHILVSDEDLVENVIAHEMGHIHYHHVYKKIALRLAECAIAVFAFYTIPELLLPILITTFAVQSFASKYFEKQADIWSMDVLQNNQGLVKFCKRIIQCQGSYIPPSTPIPIYRYEGIADEQMFELQKAAMPSSSTHPWIVDRYEYCQSYQPRAIASQRE